MSALEVTGLTIGYGRGDAVRGIDLSVADGEVACLIGANGAGKTTTLRALSGQLRPRAGRILLYGKDIVGRRPHSIAASGMAHTHAGATPLAAFEHPIPADITDQHLTALLQAAQSGCVASFERLYGLTSPRLLGIVLRIHPDCAEAEDVLQEVYLKVWRRCAQFDTDKGSVMHWLSGMARYSAIDGHRRRTSRPGMVRRSIADDEDADPS